MKDLTEINTLITPIEEPLTSITEKDFDRPRGISREEQFNKLKIDDIDRDELIMEDLYKTYKNSMPWADNVLIKISANNHYDRALKMAKEIEANETHEWHKMNVP